MNDQFQKLVMYMRLLLEKEVELIGAHFAHISSVAHYSLEFQHIQSSTTITPPKSNNTGAFDLFFSLDEMQNAVKFIFNICW